MRYTGGRRTRPLCLLLVVILAASLAWVAYRPLGSSSRTLSTGPLRLGAGAFPDAPALVEDRSLPADLYRQFATPLPRALRSPYDAVLPVPMLQRGRCLDGWIARGEVEASCGVDGSSQVEFVWTWVNGTDPNWIANQKAYGVPREIGERQKLPDRHWRDHAELQHSLRSVAAALPPSTQASFHVVLGDWEEGGQRVGQRPSWLRDDDGGGGGGRVTAVWHSQIWQDWTEYERLPELERWLERRRTLNASLPTFNSFSIEANMFNLELPSPAHVQMQDDFFLVGAHAPSDFYSALYGPVLPTTLSENGSRALSDRAMRLDPTRWNLWFPEGGLVGARPRGLPSCDHEWEALLRSNWLIGKRFGLKPRPNALHVAKPLLLPLLAEVATIWGRSHFASSVQRRFREDARRRPGDYHAVWMGQVLGQERAREALLWTWLVARLGESADKRGVLGDRALGELRAMWGIDEKERVLRAAQAKEPYTLFEKIFGRTPASLKTLVVPQTTSEHRQTLDTARVRASFDALGQPAPKASIYGWSSFDGPPPPYGATMRNCSIELVECLGGWWTSRSLRTSSVDAFKWIAFERPYCGDCILSGLLQHAGPVGLDVLLPPADRVIRVTQPTRPRVESQAHLPLTAEFRSTDFSIEGVLGSGKWGDEIHLRSWCEELIARYSWTIIANSTARFTMVRGPASMDEVAAHVVGAHPPSMLGLNDDLGLGGFSAEAVRKAREGAEKLTAFLEKQWPVKGSWER